MLLCPREKGNIEALLKSTATEAREKKRKGRRKDERSKRERERERKSYHGKWIGKEERYFKIEKRNREADKAKKKKEERNLNVLSSGILMGREISLIVVNLQRHSFSFNFKDSSFFFETSLDLHIFIE